MSHTDLVALSNLERFRFGDSPEMADELLALVLSGDKTATCWAARHGELTFVGKRMVACDGSGADRAIVETTELTHRRFCDVDEAFAAAEGEGDKSLAWWRDAHRQFFERDGVFSDQMDLWCERFRLVETLSPSSR